MTESEELKSAPEITGRRQLLRNVVVFQLKLAMDGLRDLLLSPLSIAVALYGIVVKPENPGKYFNTLLMYGRRSDAWINLFAAADHYEEDEDVQSSDAYIEKLELLLINEYKRGGLIKDLKDGSTGLFNRIRVKHQSE